MATAMVVASTMVGAQTTMDSEMWEMELVEAWSTIGDCQPETGMCDKCGFGVAVVDWNGPEGAETRTYTTGPGDLPAPWGPDSTFEIASITKPFTAITTLILEMEGILTLDSTIGEFLPCNWEEANSDVASVTLLEIIQHMSGFPAQPRKFSSQSHLQLDFLSYL